MSDTGLARIGLIRGLLSTLFVGGVIAVGYTAYLHAMGQALGFQADVAGNPWLVIPESVLEWLRDASPKATLVACAILMGHAFFGGLIAAVIAYLAVQAGLAYREGRLQILARWPFIRFRAPNKEQRQINRGETPTGREMLRPATRDIEIVIKEPNKTTYRNVFPEYYMRLSRSRLKPKRQPVNAIERMELALHEVLHAHREWPADPRGYHANTPLREHSINVARKLARKVPDEPLARVAGLAHDIGKLLAYAPVRDDQGRATDWEIRATGQDFLSAQIVRMIPEFWQLSEEDQNTLILLLTFSHSPQRLPKKGVSRRDRALLEALREADNLTTQGENETTQSKGAAPEIQKALSDNLLDALASLNINKSRDTESNADGWVNPAFDYVMVLEKALREAYIGMLDPDTSRAIGLTTRAQSGKPHPATPAIYRTLSNAGYLIDQWKGHEPDMALFDAKVGKISVTNVFLLRRDKLEAVAPDLIERWGGSAYKIFIKTAKSQRHTAGKVSSGST